MKTRRALLAALPHLLPSLLLICSSARAASIPHATAAGGDAFGGGFQVSGSQCGSACIAGNAAAASACTCPASAPLPAFFEAAVDCSAPFAPSQAFLCFPGAAPVIGASFGGAFQIDDITGSCRSPNMFSMNCSCPPSYTEWQGRVLVVDNGALLGTTLTACLGPAAPPDAPSSFGGMFQQDDDTPGGRGCRSANARTGSCSCPSSSTPLTSYRVLVDVAGGRYIGSHVVVCGIAAAPPARVEICSGYSADPSGCADASSAIQACVSAAGDGATLQLPAGVYLISTQIRISKAITLTSAASSPPPGGRGNGPSQPCYAAASACATLRASAELYAGGGVLFMHGANVSIQRIIIDGNRYNRLNSRAAQDCAGGSNFAGHNAVFSGCDCCSFESSVTMFALCGSGLAWTGKSSRITHSVVRHNGDHFARLMWSDGVTLNQASPAVVQHNLFVDNSDINLIFGSGSGSDVSDNVIFELQNAAFGGIMLDNFNGSADGDFVGMQLHNNVISCNGRCDFGLEIGPHPWYPSRNIVGGLVFSNVIDGAAILINVDGAGSLQSPVVFENNTLGSVTPHLFFICGKLFPGSAFNVLPGSFVEAAGMPPPTQIEGLCP